MTDTTRQLLAPTWLPKRVHLDPPAACDDCGRLRRVLYPRWPANAHLSLLCGACWLHAEYPSHALKIGDAVTVTAGPLNGSTGTIARRPLLGVVAVQLDNPALAFCAPIDFQAHQLTRKEDSHAV